MPDDISQHEYLGRLTSHEKEIMKALIAEKKIEECDRAGRWTGTYARRVLYLLSSGAANQLRVAT